MLKPNSPNRLFSASRAAVDTGRTVKRIGLDGAADRKGSFLNDIASDEARKVAYISDSGLRSAPETKAGIIVVDFAAGSARNLQASTLKNDETGEPFHVCSAGGPDPGIPRCLEGAGHAREPRVSVSRSIFALVDERDRAYFGHGGDDEDHFGFIGETTRSIFGRNYAAEPDRLIGQLKQDEAIAAADTLLLTVPHQLGVDYNAHVIEAILTHVAPALVARQSGWWGSS